MEKKKIIVREGTFAIYKSNAEELPVVLEQIINSYIESAKEQE